MKREAEDLEKSLNDEELEAYYKEYRLSNDPRVTKTGRILRRSHLDELPQFINVFKREMALVGPRPIVKDEIKYYGDNYPVFASVRPGITGLWQCSGRSDTSYEERVAFDVYYVLNWSPWMDIWILIRTFFSVLTLKGAC
jgi:lipopolysaccharide/colanic/teichoic acid biosynthesis glycosyltransferase